ncbi:MAG: coproporphyrinogen III oxidase [Candidatus Scalindua sp.]|nr:MAG: coproporphyrinogen III oxidase [Candidatus Scalindua sp.]
MVEEYLRAIEIELRTRAKGETFKTIFIGGGTPTVLDETQLERLFRIVSEYFEDSQLVEYSIEVNPGTLNDRKIEILKRSHINRISLGVQTFHDTYLKLLKRIHTSDRAKETFFSLRENGFSNINIDLIYGYPGQILGEWELDLKESLLLEPDHVSAYCLSYEEGTPLVHLIDSGTLSRLDEDKELEMYDYLKHTLTKSGFVHYEISNYAKNGKECLHNLIYWKNREYVGIGPGAFSYLNGERFSNIRNVKDYLSAVSSKRSVISFSEKLSPERRASETLIMALRLIRGISRKEFFDRSGFDVMDLFKEQVNDLVKADLICLDNKRVRLTKRGVSFADSVMMEFV